MELHQRLQSERARLGLGQMSAARLAGVSASTYAAWEAGTRAANTDALLLLGDAGFDVGFVLGGAHQAAALSPDLAEVTALWSRLDERTRRMLLAAMREADPCA